MIRSAILGVSMVCVALAGLSSAVPASGAESVGRAVAASASAHAVGVTSRTFVDHSRPTAANGKCDKISSRTLPTTVYYPATGDPSATTPQPDARPDTTSGPYPLIAFSHGFTATPQTYDPLLAAWAAAGYVVAAPTFPLSSGASPCGAVAGDSVNQPQDVSFVITKVLEDAHDDRLLEGLVDPHEIGVAGHSNGAITTYGLIANTKLRDPRIDVAAVLAGTPQGYPKGKYDFTKTPPLLIVHGTEDQLVPYSSAVLAFNRAHGPKGILTITGGDHGSAAAVSRVLQPTTDMFDAYLHGDAAAARRLPDDQIPGVSVMKFVRKRGSRTTIPTVPVVRHDLKAKVVPSKNLVNGQQVTVTWSGYTAGKAINILQCNPSDRDLANAAGCDYGNGHLLYPDPTGAGSVTMNVITGRVGDGTCDAKHRGCFILVNNESSTDPKNSVFLDITFAE